MPTTLFLSSVSPAGWEQRHCRDSPSQLDQLLTNRIAIANIVALALRKENHRFTSSIRVAFLYWSYLKQSNEIVRANLRAITRNRGVVRATVAGRESETSVARDKRNSRNSCSP